MGKTTTNQETGSRAELTGQTNDKDTGLKIAEAQNIGRSLAFLAHDIQNYLATVNESTGLMKDLLEHKDKCGFDRFILYFKQTQHPERAVLLPRLETIENQVSQISALTKRLSRFAHCLEEKKRILDANKVVEEVMDVLLKETRKKNIHLELKLTKQVCMIEIEPLGLQVAVFEYLKSIIKNLDPGAHVVLETMRKGHEFHVCFISPVSRGDINMLATEPDSEDVLRYMVNDLGGRIRQHNGNAKPFNTLSFVLAAGEPF